MTLSHAHPSLMTLSVANLLPYGTCRGCWRAGPITQICDNLDCARKHLRYLTQWYTYESRRWYIDAVAMAKHLQMPIREVKENELFFLTNEDIFDAGINGIGSKNSKWTPHFYLLGVEGYAINDMLPGIWEKEMMSGIRKVFDISIDQCKLVHSRDKPTDEDMQNIWNGFRVRLYYNFLHVTGRKESEDDNNEDRISRWHDNKYPDTKWTGWGKRKESSKGMEW